MTTSPTRSPELDAEATAQDASSPTDLDRPRLVAATRLFIALADAWLRRSGPQLYREDVVAARLLSAVEAVESATKLHRPVAERIARGNLVNKIAHLLRWHTKRKVDKRSRPRPAMWQHRHRYWRPGLKDDEDLAARIADEIAAAHGDLGVDFDAALSKTAATPELVNGAWLHAQREATGDDLHQPAIDVFIRAHGGPNAAAAELLSILTGESRDTLLAQQTKTGHRYVNAAQPPEGDLGSFFGAPYKQGREPLRLLGDVLGLRWVVTRILGEGPASSLLHAAQRGRSKGKSDACCCSHLGTGSTGSRSAWRVGSIRARSSEVRWRFICCDARRALATPEPVRGAS